MIEIYKDIIGYEEMYQVSNLGNIKSYKNGKEKQLKLVKITDGYLIVNLYINGIRKTRKVHQLVAESFLNHKRCGMELVVNHIDFNKTNNKLENLEIVSNRENSNRKHLKSTSKYTGVYWNKCIGKWRAYIFINGNQKHLGLFTNELEASEAYQLELSKNNRTFVK